MNRRLIPVPLYPVVQSAFAVAIGLLIGAVLMLVFRFDPVAAYLALFQEAFGNPLGLMESLANATPLMASAITFQVGMRAGVFNIGAEGQAYMGAIGAIVLGSFFALPLGIHAAVATLFAMLLGAAWALPAALLKVLRGVHEVISTIMLNFVSFWLVLFLLRNYLSDPGRAEQALPAQETARYPVIGETLTAVIFVSIAACVIVYVFLWRTGMGYELRLAGDSPEAARYAGISSSKTIILSFVVGGLAAGLAGATQVLGRPPSWTVELTLDNLVNVGFSGIGVALIGRNHPIGAILAAIFYGGLLNGGRFMEYVAKVPSELVLAVNGLIVAALSTPQIFAIVRKRRK